MFQCVQERTSVVFQNAATDATEWLPQRTESFLEQLRRAARK
jgi:hypothetical protein